MSTNNFLLIAYVLYLKYLSQQAPESSLNHPLSEAEVSSGGLWLTATCWPWLDSTSIQAAPAIIIWGILILSQAMFSFHSEDLQTQTSQLSQQKGSGEGSYRGKWTVWAVKVPFGKVRLSSPETASEVCSNVLNNLNMFPWKANSTYNANSDCPLSEAKVISSMQLTHLQNVFWLHNIFVFQNSKRERVKNYCHDLADRHDRLHVGLNR